MSLENLKQRQQRDVITHLLQWLKSKTLTTVNAGEDMEQQKFSFIDYGNAKWSSHFGRQFGSFLHC